jgi:hypothetical protein
MKSSYFMRNVNDTNVSAYYVTSTQRRMAVKLHVDWDSGTKRKKVVNLRSVRFIPGK